MYFEITKSDKVLLTCSWQRGWYHCYFTIFAQPHFHSLVTISFQHFHNSRRHYCDETASDLERPFFVVFDDRGVICSRKHLFFGTLPIPLSIRLNCQCILILILSRFCIYKHGFLKCLPRDCA